jgi:DNA-binding transcriptional regulator YiaG
MATSAAMAKSIDKVEKDLNELIRETGGKVAPAMRERFNILVTSTQVKFTEALFKEIEDYIRPRKKSETEKPECPGPSGHIERPILTLSREAENCIAERLPRVLFKWRRLRTEIEALSRRLELRNSSTEQDFKRTLMWMAERGMEVDLALLDEVKKDPLYKSDEINRLIEITEDKISERVSNRNDRDKELRRFFNLSAKQFAHLIGVANEETGESILQHKSNMLRKLRLIKEILKSMFEQEEINRWLRASNPTFDGQAPIDVIAKGDTDRVLQVLSPLDKGMPNY